jgi:hypothetical protein
VVQEEAEMSEDRASIEKVAGVPADTATGNENGIAREFPAAENTDEVLVHGTVQAVAEASEVSPATERVEEVPADTEMPDHTGITQELPPMKLLKKLRRRRRRKSQTVLRRLKEPLNCWQTEECLIRPESRRNFHQLEMSKRFK